MLLIIAYLGVAAWKQQEEIIYLKEVISEQDEAISKQQELIEVQIRYIDILAPGFYNPLNKENNSNSPVFH